MTERQPDILPSKPQIEVVSDLFLELREDFIGHIGATAIEVKRK